jgi:hypothetical protein
LIDQSLSISDRSFRCLSRVVEGMSTWVLDSGTKGTGANVVPLEKVEREADAGPRRLQRPEQGKKRSAPRPRDAGNRQSAPAEPRATSSTALPPGHVRKKGTGEIGAVKTVDPRAGTATVRWLKSGATSTVPLASISRR